MAFRLSNNVVVGVPDAITLLLLSVPVLAAGIWLGARGADGYPSAPPVVALGIFLTFISLAGLVGGACRRVTCLLWFYLCAMFILTALLFCFTIFTVAVTNKVAAGETVSGRGYKENWLQKRLENTKNWNQDSKTLQAKKWTQDQFFHADLFSLEHRLPTNGSFNCHHMLSQSASGSIFAAAAAGKLNHIAVAQPELNSNLPFDPTVQFIVLMILTVQAAGRRLHKKNKSPRGKGTAAAAAAALLVLLAVAALPNSAVAARPLHGGGRVVQAASSPVAAAPSPAMMMPKSLASSGRSSCTNDPNTMGTGRPCIHQ